MNKSSLNGKFETSLPGQQYRLIHDIYVFLDAGDTRTLGAFNLTPSQYRLLMLLDPHRGQNLIRLSERMLVARSTITRLIDQLAGEGYIQRVDDPNDRRAQHVALTPHGAEVRERVHAAHEESLKVRFAALSDAQQLKMRELLAAFRDGLLKQLESQQE